MDHDYYQLLNVHSDASLEAIKKAYRKKAMECHPDRGGSHEQMKLINLAWEILSDPEARVRYDQSRAAPSNFSLQQVRHADQDRAEQRAQEYPRQWSEFEKWLNHVASDFRDAKYGTENMRTPAGRSSIQFPTVQNSTSGVIFLLAGAILGGWLLGLPIYEAITSRRLATKYVAATVALSSLAVGAWLGIWIHQWIGHLSSITSTATSKPAQTTSSAGTCILSCKNCQQKLRVPAGNQELLVTCKRCRHQFTFNGKEAS